MRLYLFTFPFILLFYACSSPGGNTAKKTDTIRQVPSGQPDSQAILKASSFNRSPEDSAALDLQITQESTLSSRQTNMTIPPYGLENVKVAISKMRSINDTDADGFTIALNEPVYASFSFGEKFTYNMIHAEDYSQMCDMLPLRENEDQRIYGQLPNFFGEYSWSKRQMTFFTANRDSVEQLMKAVIGKEGKAGVNFLEVIVSMNGKEMIPYLIDVYHKNNSNHYILTALMLLMRDNKYPEFLQSSSWNKLYNKDTDTYSAFLVYNTANENLIIQRATNFYNASVHQ